MSSVPNQEIELWLECFNGTQDTRFSVRSGPEIFYYINIKLKSKFSNHPFYSLEVKLLVFIHMAAPIIPVLRQIRFFILVPISLQSSNIVLGLFAVVKSNFISYGIQRFNAAFTRALQ